MSAVEVARIHLAIPKSSVFVRDQLKPTASVLLNLRPGRSLEQGQVNAIVHLVASSVPELNASDVTVVDQNGNLLTDSTKKDTNSLDPSQLKYVNDLQDNIAKRIESIIAPIVGPKNVHAEASAEVDFSVQEQAAEQYKPNQTADAAAIRSQQSTESKTSDSTNATGVPGALSNQPPSPATAPLVTSPPANANAAKGSATTAPDANPPTPVNTEKNLTTNYELDKTVRYTQQPMGGVKRLSVAVVVNHLQSVDAKGKVTSRALTDDEKNQISDLAKQAMGFNADRGDTLTVVNSSFVPDTTEVMPEIPMWKQPENIEMAKEFLKIIVAVVVIILLYFRIMKPMLRKLTPDSQARLTSAQDQDTIVNLGASPQIESRPPAAKAYEQNLEAAKQLAKENPKLVANLVTNWVSNNE
jgi:flagellar M-ring protein FliF